MYTTTLTSGCYSSLPLPIKTCLWLSQSNDLGLFLLSYFFGCFCFLKKNQIVRYFDLSFACRKQGKASQAGSCHMLWCVLGISHVRRMASCVVSSFVCLLWKTSSLQCYESRWCSWLQLEACCEWVAHQLWGEMPVWLGLLSECWELAVRSVKLQGFLLVPSCCRSKVKQEILAGQIKARSKDASVASLCLPLMEGSGVVAFFVPLVGFVPVQTRTFSISSMQNSVSHRNTKHSISLFSSWQTNNCHFGNHWAVGARCMRWRTSFFLCCRALRKWAREEDSAAPLLLSWHMLLNHYLAQMTWKSAAPTLNKKSQWTDIYKFEVDQSRYFYWNNLVLLLKQ